MIPALARNGLTHTSRRSRSAADGETLSMCSRSRSAAIIVGRSPDNEIYIKSKFVSRHHAQLVSDENRLRHRRPEQHQRCVRWRAAGQEIPPARRRRRVSLACARARLHTISARPRRQDGSETRTNEEERSRGRTRRPQTIRTAVVTRIRSVHPAASPSRLCVDP